MMKKVIFFITIAGILVTCLYCSNIDETEDIEVIPFQTLEYSQQREIIKNLVELRNFTDIDDDMSYGDCYTTDYSCALYEISWVDTSQCTDLQNPDTDKDQFCNIYTNDSQSIITIGDKSTPDGTLIQKLSMDIESSETSEEVAQYYTYDANIRNEYTSWNQEIDDNIWEFSGYFDLEINFTIIVGHSMFDVLHGYMYNAVNNAGGLISMKTPYLDFEDCDLTTAIEAKDEYLLLTDASLCGVEVHNLHIIFYRIPPGRTVSLP